MTRAKMRFAATLGSLAVLALAVSIAARLTARFPGDLWLTLRLQSFHSDFFLAISRDLAFVFGGSWASVVLVVAGAVFALWCAGRLGALIVVVGGVLTFTNVLFKLAVDRARPSADLVQVFSHEHSSGFPSGHALFALVVLGLVSYFAVVGLESRVARIAIATCLIAVALLVGISRVYLGAHWPSDVLGGYLIGGVFLVALIWFHWAWEDNHKVGSVPP